MVEPISETTVGTEKEIYQIRGFPLVSAVRTFLRELSRCLLIS